MGERNPATVVVLLISGCASYGVVEDESGQGTAGGRRYSISLFMEGRNTGENAPILPFAGGGAPAATLSYGVLNELPGTPSPPREKPANC